MNILKSAAQWLLIYVCIWFLASMFTPYDSTDDAENSERSGMRLYIDHGTGCQYLSGGGLFGPIGITPRLDSDGDQVCE